MIQGAIFDFDNTLYDYDISNTEGLKAVFEYIKKEFGIDETKTSNIYNQINRSIKNSNNYANKFNKSIYFKQLLEKLHISFLHLDTILNAYNESFFHNMKLYDGVIELFELFIRHNIQICILSNNVFYQQYKKLAELNILKYIHHIQTSDEVGYEKPNTNIFLAAMHKMNILPEHIILFGDNYFHDIEPAMQLGIMTFYKFGGINPLVSEKPISGLFVSQNVPFELQRVNLKNKTCISFNKYTDLCVMFNEYFRAEEEYVFLSKFFGQSELNVQGQGGNISIKTNFYNNTLLLIKSSGCILGNADTNNGFCIVNNDEVCNSNDLKTTKLFGHKTPSMETYFHSYMKKYTVHIHFTLSNIFLCTNNTKGLHDFTVNHAIIEYYPPGKILSDKIHEQYNTSCDIYFLKNHGVIITNHTLEGILASYKYLYDYFNVNLQNKYLYEYIKFDINRYIYETYGRTVVCRQYVYDDIDCIINIQYCFPDLAVYVQNICDITNIQDLCCVPDIVIYRGSSIPLMFVIADNLTKLYCLIETLNSYIELCKYNKHLKVIDERVINNMEQEKYRRLA